MYELPTEITIDGRQYNIRNKGDYRVILDAFSALEDEELDNTERVISALIIFYESFNDLEDILQEKNVAELVQKMYWFFRGGKDDDVSNTNGQKLIDWEGDSDIIISAINNVARREIREPSYTHWWTFLAYYMAVGESLLSTVVGIRNKLIKGKSLEKWEREFRQHNPQYFKWKHKTVDEIDAENWVAEMWNSGKE